MKINGEDDLRNILSRAFEAYANRVQNGPTQPFQSFLQGYKSIDATIILNDDGTITLKEITPNEPITPVTEPIHLVDPQIPQSQEDIDANSVPVEEEKPKRKKKTEEVTE